MKTLVLYPCKIKRAEAYQEVGTGEMWGPLWPFLWRNKAESGYREPELMKISAGETFESYVRKMSPSWTPEATTLHIGQPDPAGIHDQQGVRDAGPGRDDAESGGAAI